MNVTTTQGRRCRANIPMDVFAILYVVTTYHHRCHAGILMNEFRNINAFMVQRNGCYSNIQMNVSVIANVATTQRCKRCTFDSPGLASESVVHPELFAVSGNNAVGVVPFIPRHFVTAFHSENVQHLRR